MLSDMLSDNVLISDNITLSDSIVRYEPYMRFRHRERKLMRFRCRLQSFGLTSAILKSNILQFAFMAPAPEQQYFVRESGCTVLYMR
jgi:hypothetical protein